MTVILACQSLEADVYDNKRDMTSLEAGLDFCLAINASILQFSLKAVQPVILG